MVLIVADVQKRAYIPALILLPLCIDYAGYIFGMQWWLLGRVSVVLALLLTRNWLLRGACGLFSASMALCRMQTGAFDLLAYGIAACIVWVWRRSLLRSPLAYSVAAGALVGMINGISLLLLSIAHGAPVSYWTSHMVLGNILIAVIYTYSIPQGE